MAEISQNVNIEMLEKLPDGTYKRKYPKTVKEQVGLNNVDNVKQATKVEFDEHLAEDATQAHLAKSIGLEDVEGKFVATNLEGAMNELFTNVSNGKQLVGGAITGVDDSVVIPADPTFQDLANAIEGISTGKKWASGTVTADRNGSLIVTGLSFRPKTIILKGNDLYHSFFFFNEDKMTDPALGYVRVRDKTALWFTSSQINITNTSFSLETGLANVVLEWIATE